MELSREEREQYRKGLEVGAAIVQSHVSLGLGGVGVSLVQSLALQGAGGLAQAQGLADAALVALESAQGK